MSRPPAPAKVVFDDRYELRPIEPSDTPQVQEAFYQSLPQLHRFMNWSHYPMNEERFLERVLNQHAHYFKGVDYELGMFDQASGEFLVYTGFYPVNRINPLCVEIGFWTVSRHAGKGLATLATRIQIALLFEYFRCDRIEITCNVENGASRRVIEKCGFQFEGNMRNFYPLGTEQMYAKGFVKERTASLFALISEDCKKLAWYEEIVGKTLLFPLLKPAHPLKDSERGKKR